MIAKEKKQPEQTTDFSKVAREYRNEKIAYFFGGLSEQKLLTDDLYTLQDAMRDVMTTCVHTGVCSSLAKVLACYIKHSDDEPTEHEKVVSNIVSLIDMCERMCMTQHDVNLFVNWFEKISDK